MAADEGDSKGRAGEPERALLTAVKLLPELLAGDSRFGDPLSTAGRRGSHQIGRRLTELTADRPSLLREAGLSALQVWEGWRARRGPDGRMPR
jgi:adenylate cyclase